VMSTCDAFMVHSAALITRNVYLPYINPKATDAQLLRVGRMTSIITVVGGVLFAFAFPSVVHGLIEVWKVTAYLGVAFWAGVMWKRANRYGAWASGITMAALSIYSGNILGWSLPEQISLYLPAGIIVMVVVSWFTTPEPAEKLRQFYLLLQTPVGKEDRLKAAGVKIKLEGLSEAEPTSKLERMFYTKDIDDGLLIVDFFKLYKNFSWKKYRTDLIGFGFAALLAVSIVFLAVILAGIGA